MTTSPEINERIEHMAMTPTQEAQYALDYEGNRKDLKPEARAEYDRLVRARQDRREAEHALGFGLPREDLRPEAQAEYDRLVASGTQVAPGIFTSQDEITARTSPEIRARILAMFKKANSKYAKPFDKDRLAVVSVMGGNWEEYGQVVLSMAILDTLLSIEEKLDRLGEQSE